jgi:twinkle protein
MRDGHEHGAPRGISKGWPPMNPHYRVMTGEWTLVTGIPGAGKSEWLDALSVNLARDRGWTFGVFSPENQPLEYYADKLAERFVGKPEEPGPTERMTVTEHEAAMDRLESHFTFIQPESPTIDSLLEIGRSLVKSKGIRGLILNPWNEVDHMRPPALTETEYISQSLSKVRKFAREKGVHVRIVAYPRILRKEDGVYPLPTPYDVAGQRGARANPRPEGPEEAERPDRHGRASIQRGGRAVSLRAKLRAAGTARAASKTP